MKKNAFTLIELLAVIVILAIIALIATPIILGIIKDAKEQSTKRSAELYIDAVEQAIVRKNLEGEYNPEECKIENGEVNCKGKFSPKYCKIIDGQLNCDGVPLEVEIDGEIPEDGTIIKFENGKVTIDTELIFKNFKVKINKEGKLVISPKEEKKDDIIEEGPEHLAQKNVKAIITPTTGIIPVVENEQIKPGSEFQIQVNDNSGWLTFFVLSNDGEYVNLIAEQNITPDGKYTKEPQKGTEWILTELELFLNEYGPQTAYTYLCNATKNWTNVPIIKNFYYEDEGYKGNPNYGYQNIKTELDEQSGNYITTITPNPVVSEAPAKYENMRARLPKPSEVKSKEVGCSITAGSCPLWIVNYIYLDNPESLPSTEEYYNESNGKVSSLGSNFGYWLLSSEVNDDFYVHNVCHWGSIGTYDSNINEYGIRPVITVLKSDLLRVME